MTYQLVHAPDRLILEPERAADSCVMMLHGLGAEADDFLELPSLLDWPEDLPVRWLFPQAPRMPVTANQGWVMPSWFDIDRFDDEMTVSSEAIWGQVEWLQAQLQAQWSMGIESSRTLVMGFSQGAAMALWTGLTQEHPLAGVVCLSGFLPEAEAWKQRACCPQTPILFQHGLADSVVYPDWGRAAYACVSERYSNVRWVDSEGDHAVHAEGFEELRRWMQACLMP